MAEGETTGVRLRALMDRAGLTVRGFAKAAGYAHGSGVQRFIESEFDGQLRPDVARRFAEALVGKGAPPIESADVYSLIGIPEANAVPQAFEGASMERMKNDLPILGTALGADRIVDDHAIEQTNLYASEVVGYAKRPVILDGRADAYGIYVQGSSMEPAHADGALILVETKRPPRIGDDVVIHLRKHGDADDSDDGQNARTVLVKRLLRRNGTTIELQQFNPQLTFRIAACDVLKLHRVMTLGDLLS